MYERLLVPTDGSAVAEAAARAAIHLAARYGAEVHAMHVLEPGELRPGVDDEDADREATVGKRALDAVADEAADAGVPLTTAMLDDVETTHDAILEYVADHDVDCVVMGTHGRSGLDRFVLGSVAERTLRESPVPVLTVHEETVLDVEFDDLLVPTDGSDAAEAAADHAVALADADGLDLHVVNVVDPAHVTADVGAGAVLSALEEAGQNAMNRVAERAEAAGVDAVRTTGLRGPPHRAILEYAADEDVDCIVMGTHGRTGVERYLLGSVTERVVRHAEVPVLAVPGADDGE